MNFLTVAVIGRYLAWDGLAVAQHVALVLDYFEMTLSRMLYLVDEAQRPIMGIAIDVHMDPPESVLSLGSRVSSYRIEARESNTRHKTPDSRLLLHSVLGHHLVDEAALIDLLENAVVDQLFRLDALDLRIGAFHEPDDVGGAGGVGVRLAVESVDHVFVAFFSILLGDAQIFLQDFQCDRFLCR